MYGGILCPESLCVELCDRHRGIGGFGIVLIEHSDCADAAMRIFNSDGTEGYVAGNSLRCVGKYLYDNGIVPRRDMTVQTRAGICRLHLYTRGGLVSSVTVNMGAPDFAASAVPVTLDMPRVVNSPIEIGGTEYRVTCLSMGNPHCVVFTDNVDKVDLGRIGPLFENSPLFPHRTNAEFVRVVNPAMLKLRVFERGNGETSACGTGCCAAVCAAVENGCCEKNTDITVKTRGGGLIVRYSDDGVTLTGDAVLVYRGELEY